jgi:hypothetical protein
MRIARSAHLRRAILHSGGSGILGCGLLLCRAVILFTFLLALVRTFGLCVATVIVQEHDRLKRQFTVTMSVLRRTAQVRDPCSTVGAGASSSMFFRTIQPDPSEEARNSIRMLENLLCCRCACRKRGVLEEVGCRGKVASGLKAARRR